MKVLLYLFFFTYTSIGFSQTKHQLFDDKYDEFILYAKPSQTNKLSKYFVKRIDSKLLDNYKISDTIKNKKYICLTFKFAEGGKLTNIIVSSPYTELNKSIREAFKNYTIDDLNILDKNPLNTYTIQILSKVGDKMVVNCSTNIVYDRPPVFEGCESCITSLKVNNCFYKKISEHIINTISPTEIKRAKILGMLDLGINFIVNEQGSIEQINCKTPTDSLSQELNRVVALFPKAKIPATRNGNPTRFVFKKTIGFQIDSDNEKYKQEIEEKQNEGFLNSKDTLLNTNSLLALHFKNYISGEELQKIVLPLKQRSLYLSFNIDKKGEIVNLKTNSDQPKLNDRLVKIFNRFPFEQLNIQSSRILESYRYPIIIEKFNKNIIASKDVPTILTPAIFEKRCEKSKNSADLFDCFNQNIREVVAAKFKGNIQYKTALKGRIKITCIFQIDVDGKIINVKAFAPNPIITNELEQIIQNISQVYKPAFINGKAEITSYKFSYIFNVRENKINNFKSW